MSTSLNSNIDEVKLNINEFSIVKSELNPLKKVILDLMLICFITELFINILEDLNIKEETFDWEDIFLIKIVNTKSLEFNVTSNRQVTFLFEQ